MRIFNRVLLILFVFCVLHVSYSSCKLRVLCLGCTSWNPFGPVFCPFWDTVKSHTYIGCQRGKLAGAAFSVSEGMYVCMLHSCMHAWMDRSIDLSIYPSIHPSIHPSVPSVHPSIDRSIRPSIYVSMYLCIYVSMYLCIYASMYLCIYVSMYLCSYVYVSVYLCICVSVYLCICIYVGKYRWMDGWMYLCIYVSMYLCIYASMHLKLLSKDCKTIYQWRASRRQHLYWPCEELLQFGEELKNVKNRILRKPHYCDQDRSSTASLFFGEKKLSR